MSGLADSSSRESFSSNIVMISIISSSLTYMLGVHMVRPIIALYFNSVGYAALMIGFFVSLNAVIPILFGMSIGSWIDRMGTRRAVITGSALCLISGLAFIAGIRLENVALVLFGLVLNGFGGMFSWGALQAAASIAANQSSEKRGNHLISNFAFVNSMGQLTGPSLGGYFSDFGGYSLVFYIFTSLNVLGIILASILPIGSYTRGSRQEAKLTVKEPLWQSYKDGYTLLRKNKPFAVAILLNGVLFMLVDVRTTFFPLFLSGTGLSHTQIGNMLSVSALAALLVRPMTGYLMSLLGHRRIMLISIFSGAVCLLLLMVKAEFWLLTAIVFIWGACTSVNQPVALMMVSHTVEPGERGMAMSLRTMSNRFVQLTNPILFGALTTAVGLTFGFAVLGVLLLSFGIVYQRQNRPRPAASVNGSETGV